MSNIIKETHIMGGIRANFIPNGEKIKGWNDLKPTFKKTNDIVIIQIDAMHFLKTITNKEISFIDAISIYHIDYLTNSIESTNLIELLFHKSLSFLISRFDYHFKGTKFEDYHPHPIVDANKLATSFIASIFEDK